MFNNRIFTENQRFLAQAADGVSQKYPFETPTVHLSGSKDIDNDDAINSEERLQSEVSIQRRSLVAKSMRIQ